jgi:hypothetical protein
MFYIPQAGVFQVIHSVRSFQITCFRVGIDVRRQDIMERVSEHSLHRISDSLFMTDITGLTTEASGSIPGRLKTFLSFLTHV